jgi:hypothetical protein
MSVRPGSEERRSDSVHRPSTFGRDDSLRRVGRVKSQNPFSRKPVAPLIFHNPQVSGGGQHKYVVGVVGRRAKDWRSA